MTVILFFIRPFVEGLVNENEPPDGSNAAAEDVEIVDVLSVIDEGSDNNSSNKNDCIFNQNKNLEYFKTASLIFQMTRPPVPAKANAVVLKRGLKISVIPKCLLVLSTSI